MNTGFFTTEELRYHSPVNNRLVAKYGHKFAYAFCKLIEIFGTGEPLSGGFFYVNRKVWADLAFMSPSTITVIVEKAINDNLLVTKTIRRKEVFRINWMLLHLLTTRGVLQ